MGSLRLGFDPWGEEIFLRNMVRPATSFPVVGESINVFLIGTDGSVKLVLAPFYFALAIKENSLQPRKYTEPFARGIFLSTYADKYQKMCFTAASLSLPTGVHLHILLKLKSPETKVNPIYR